MAMTTFEEFAGLPPTTEQLKGKLEHMRDGFTHRGCECCRDYDCSAQGSKGNLGCAWHTDNLRRDGLYDLYVRLVRAGRIH